MSEPIPLTARPQLNTQRRTPQGPQVMARMESHNGNVMPAQDPNAVGLLKGLAALNPAIHDYFKVDDAIQMDEGAKQAAVDVQRMADPRTALSGPIEGPEGSSPAFAASYRKNLQEGLANRAASEIKVETLSDYMEESKKPGFDANAWLGERRAKAMAGVSDPTAQAVIGAHFQTLEEQLGVEAARQRMQKLQEVNNTTASAYATESFTGNMKPDELHAAYPLFLQKVQGLGFTPKEANQFMFNQIQHESMKLGGVPELFDVFDQQGPDGVSIRNQHPDLIDNIDKAKSHALALREKGINAAAEHDNTVKLMNYESRVNADPYSVSEDEILHDQSPNGVFQTKEAAAGMWSKVLTARKEKVKLIQGMELMKTGDLWQLDPGDQDKVLTEAFKPAIQALAGMTHSGDPSGASQVAYQIMQIQSKAGSTVPSDQLARYVKTLVTAMPDAKGPSSAFKTASELYKAMSANPSFRAMYFDEKTTRLLDSYTSAVGNGSDPIAAYTQAYQAESPEAKAAAEAYVKSPEFVQKVKDESRKWVEGSSMWPRWLGGNSRPQNPDFVSTSVTLEMQAWRARNPYATDKEAESYAESWVNKNFVLDEEGRAAIKVPPGVDTKAAQEAFSAYSKKMVRAYNLDRMSGDDWSVQYSPAGTEGYYTVMAFNGASIQQLGRVNVNQLLEMQRASKILTPEERQLIGKAKQGMATGSFVELPFELIAKAGLTKAFSKDEENAYRTFYNKKMVDRITQVPLMSFGAPSLSNLQITRPGAPLDNQLTAQSALDFARSGGGNQNYALPTNTKHVSLAASLVTMGEGLSLQRYQDPAKGAGMNIGMGYNLNANKDHAVSDLTMAGVPQERIQDVIEGRASLTQRQAERLLLNTLPRFADQVKRTADATNPELWGRMTPAQKAVMIDVAYQAGDPAKFKKAWAALSANDPKIFAEETKVTYTNQAGAKVEDTRRNNLRASLLTGTSHWEAAIKTFAKLPSSKLQAATVASTGK